MFNVTWRTLIQPKYFKPYLYYSLLCIDTMKKKRKIAFLIKCENYVVNSHSNKKTENDNCVYEWV